MALRRGYSQRTAVDDQHGIPVDIEEVTGEAHDTRRFEERLAAIEATLNRRVQRVTADAGYGIGRIFAALQNRGTASVTPHRRSGKRPAPGVIAPGASNMTVSRMSCAAREGM